MFDADTSLRRPAQTSCLLKVPVEIRLHIYEEVLCVGPWLKRNISLLSVCRQVFGEAQPYLFRRRLPFEDQSDLDKWLQATAVEDLPLVRQIETGFDVIEGLADLGPGAADVPLSLVREIELWRKAHAVRFREALRRLPGLQDLTIRDHAGKVALAESSPGACLTAAGAVCSHLQKLSFSFEDVSLEFLSSMPRLRSLSFQGFSYTSPEDTLTILRGLPQLDELCLTGPPMDLNWKQRTGFEGRRVIQSITPEVIRGLRPLRALSIFQAMATGMSGGQDSFFQPDVLLAVHSSHIASLRRLCISAAIPATRETVDALSTLLSKSSLRRLCIACLKLPVRILSSVPASVHSLHIGICGQSALADFPPAILANRGPNLRDVFLAVSMRGRVVKQIIEAKAPLKRAGIRVLCGVWLLEWQGRQRSTLMRSLFGVRLAWEDPMESYDWAWEDPMESYG
ncbi:MAG: hypothetical protein M1832_000584 [Thelocarpon impressellum]|nr:MAG: hypothetical protein M1832_000584 [Thelocarpon impressellum]